LIKGDYEMDAEAKVQLRKTAKNRIITPKSKGGSNA
jgi:hypothetical protein